MLLMFNYKTTSVVLKDKHASESPGGLVTLDCRILPSVDLEGELENLHCISCCCSRDLTLKMTLCVYTHTHTHTHTQ